LRDASAGGFDAHSVASGILCLLVLGVVRLLSERPIWGLRRERPMNKTGKHKKNSNDSKSPRKYHQFVLETIWAGAAGVMVGRWLP
jgi:hypothetical protein